MIGMQMKQWQLQCNDLESWLSSAPDGARSNKRCKQTSTGRGISLLGQPIALSVLQKRLDIVEFEH